MKLDYLLVSNQELSNPQKRQIIALKNCYWKYPYASQVKWMDENLNDNDYHLMLYCDNMLCAYLDLVDIEISVDGGRIDAIGIGNVCTAPQLVGKGVGKECVKRVNEIIRDKNKLGILLCHEPLFPFYRKCGWVKVETENTRVIIAYSDYNNLVMTYNCPKTCNLHKAKEIYINRNF